jgi:hypothetical protein
MGRYATRSVFAAVLCAGVAMVGASVNGLLGVDAELQRSAFAADQIRTFHHVADHRTVEPESRHVIHEQDLDCPGAPPARHSNHLS